MEFKVENLCGFLIRSKLMTPQEMQAMRQRWQADAKDNASDAARFLKWLIANNLVTEYQASLLSRGHVDDFYLGDYKLLERIGRGRMAGVYRAVHPSGQVVAIKVLPPSRAKNPQMLARFQREARLSVKLVHPHIVRSFQVGEARGVHFLVMEYLEGETLDDVLQRRKRLPASEAVRLIHQALLGLQHIHERGMVHRDLKPSNLMLLPTPLRGPNETTLKSNVKILDIGLAREFFDENSPAESLEKMELTGEGVLLGTPDYLAPEQARDPRTIDIRADIYSLGCTLYHLLSGHPPFPDKNILNQMIRHATEAPKPLHLLNDSIPEGLTQIVNWMMAKKPDERYPTPARAAQALDAFLMVVSEPPKGPEETPQLKKYLTWLEMSENPVEVTGAPSTMPMAPRAKPASSPKVPIAASIKPAPKPATNPNSPVLQAKAAPERKRKRRTGVKIPIAEAPVSAPAVAAPPTPAAPLTPDQIDVELIEISPPAAAPAPPKSRSVLRDLLLFAAGAGLILFFLGVWAAVSVILQMVSGE